MLETSCSNTLASVPSSGTTVKFSSSDNHRIGAGSGLAPENGARKMTSMMAVRWSSPLGRKRYTIRLKAPHGWKFGKIV